MHEQEDQLFRRGDQDIVGADRGVGGGDGGAQVGIALRLGVAQAQCFPTAQQGGRGLRQQLGQAQALAVRGAEQVLDVEFITGKVAFETEWLHGSLQGK